MSEISVWRRVGAVALLLAVTGCGIPHDPDGTLDRVREQQLLRAGASHHPPFVQVESPDADPTGSEVELVEAYAEHLGADVEWTVGSEATLVEALEEGDIDVLAAGLADDSPWADRVGLTRPYAEKTDGPAGEQKSIVLAVAMGENALLVDLERWLDENGGGA